MRRVSSEGLKENEQNDKCDRLLATFILRENENLLDNVFFSLSANTGVTCPSWRKRLLRGQNFVRTTWNSAGLSPRVTRQGQCYQSLCQIVWINCSHKLSLLQHRNESNIRFPCTSSKTVPATRVLCEHTKGLVHASRVRIMPLINVSHLLATRPQSNTRMFAWLPWLRLLLWLSNPREPVL